MREIHATFVDLQRAYFPGLRVELFIEDIPDHYEALACTEPAAGTVMTCCEPIFINTRDHAVVILDARAAHWRPEKELIHTLCHELAHAGAFERPEWKPDEPAHGTCWVAEMCRIGALGAPGLQLWPYTALEYVERFSALERKGLV